MATVNINSSIDSLLVEASNTLDVENNILVAWNNLLFDANIKKDFEKNK